jgi:hypothetical protein
VLGLDYYSLKKRVEDAASEAASNSPAFVELPAPVVPSRQCQFELDNGAGATLRLHPVGYDAADVATVARSVWNAEAIAAHPADEDPGAPGTGNSVFSNASWHSRITNVFSEIDRPRSCILARVGPIHLRAQAEVASARRTDTPK